MFIMHVSCIGALNPLLTCAKDLLALWHLYRLPLILAMASILALLRIAIYLKTPRKKLSESPLPESPILKPKEEKKVLSDSPPAAVGRGPRRIVGNAKKAKVSPQRDATKCTKIQTLVFFYSLTGTTEKHARDFTAQLAQDLKHNQDAIETVLLEPTLHDLSYIEFDDHFITTPQSSPEIQYFYLLLLPTYNIDTILDNFLEHLKDTHNDFRIDTAPLSRLLGYSVFGFGDREGWPTEDEGFCSQARETDRWMAKLTGRKRAFPLGVGDTGKKGDIDTRLREWRLGVVDVTKQLAETGALGEGVEGSGEAVESEEEDMAYDDGEVVLGKRSSVAKRVKEEKMDSLNDLEDIGGTLSNLSASTTKNTSELETDFTTTQPKKKFAAAIKEMVPRGSPTYNALTKQGYSIVGSHSGVKICRWTKSALRGRGSCYKYSFYGIASHQCMETTPSLSCSNKCVFCWRHGTNPVGTSWRWTVDPPSLIFTGVKENHYKKIKMLRGVPGVRAERFAEAMKIRHCALSLVGEPIFYPRINEFVDLLHAERISTFLVCNAQHPEQLERLKQVTQLYVSIDASNRESLRKIDRPLHRDFWERFERCLDILKAKRDKQRTVFRLTLVKGFNIEEEVEGYADLVLRALPCFVEIKGVTYCGTSSSAGAGLTMQNVPFYEEVCGFVKALDAALRERGLGYGIAAEHAHSCCVLIASGKFRKEGKWHTRIDYQKFFELLEGGGEFGPLDYVGEETPDWACWGKGGFDPRDERVFRKGKERKVVEEVGND